MARGGTVTVQASDSGLSRRSGAVPGFPHATPGRVMAQEEAAEFVGSPDDKGEGGDGGELGRGELCCAEDAVQGRYVDQRGGECQRDADSGEQEPVGEHAN